MEMYGEQTNNGISSHPVVRKPVAGMILKSRVDKNKLLRQGIWLYFILLIFEGAFRKWFLPSLAAPLLVVRDPIALWVMITAFRLGLIRTNRYIVGMLMLGLIGIFTAIFLGHGNLYVALYGARILMIHFPFIFVIGRVFTRSDVLQLGRVMLWISIPMAVLICLQFYSPQSAWVNRGVGGDLNGAGFSGALGYFRPPGTFSFINGTANFFSMTAAFVFYFWFNPKEVNKIILIGATAAVLASIPFSISRELFFSVCVSLAFALLAVMRKPKYAGKMILAAAAIIAALALLSNTSLLKPAKEAFSDRFETANDAEGGVVRGVIADRYLGSLIRSATGTSNIPFFGFGMGMGTNVGSQILTGDTQFLIAEGEWGRLVGEMGAVMGLSVIFIRLALSIKLARASFRSLKKGNLLPWMLLSFGLLTIPQGLWSQPTSLGFGVVIGGLIIASLTRAVKQSV
jgi:hypothetical protein